MAYQTALTIAEVVNDIHRKKYLLPAIQREFVCDTNQIERLFDSLMRDYPISSFLFWGVEKEKVNDFEFYEFLRQYHERKQVHNPKASVSGEEGVTAVLDGQQRLTSIYIALKGTYAYKIPRKRWDNDQAYPERKLHLNILSPSTNEGREFDFEFLTADEANENNETTFWFPVPNILDLKELEDISNFLIENGIFSEYPKEIASFANKALSKLYKVIHIDPSISYFLEKSQQLDKVLNIFIRINSGGTILSYSDLLLSIATAQWEEKDAREEITKFVDEINNVRSGFKFNKDFVLKSCLILSDFSDIAFKVDNFNKSNMMIIESNWEKIAKAIRLAVELVASFGYSRETLMSNNRSSGGSFSKDASKLVYSSDKSGIFNIYEVNLENNIETQITDSKEESFFVRGYSPTTGEVIYSADKGGNENSHVYIIRDEESIDLTPGENTRASFFGWTNDELGMYIQSNSRDPRFFDLYEINIKTL